MLQSMGSQRVGYNWATEHQPLTVLAARILHKFTVAFALMELFTSLEHKQGQPLPLTLGPPWQSSLDVGTMFSSLIDPFFHHMPPAGAWNNDLVMFRDFNTGVGWVPVFSEAALYNREFGLGTKLFWIKLDGWEVVNVFQKGFGKFLKTTEGSNHMFP